MILVESGAGSRAECEKMSWIINSTESSGSDDRSISDDLAHDILIDAEISYEG